MTFRIAGTREGENLTTLKTCDLRDDVSGCAKTVNAESFCVVRLTQRSISNQASAKERRGGNVVKDIGNWKAEAFVGHGELCITAIYRVAGESRVITKILAIRPTEFALAARPTEPWNPNAIADFESIHIFADGFHAPDNFVAENERQLRLRKFAIDDMQIGATDSAGGNADKHLTRIWSWCRCVAQD